MDEVEAGLIDGFPAVRIYALFTLPPSKRAYSYIGVQFLIPSQIVDLHLFNPHPVVE